MPFCCTAAELRLSASFRALAWGFFFMVIGLEWRLYTVVQTKQYSLAQLLPQILCGKGRKDCLYCSDTTWLCASILFDLLSHSIFSEYCKSPITTTVFQNSTPKPRKSTLSVTTHQTMKYLTSLYKFIKLLHPLKNVFSFFFFLSIVSCYSSSYQSQYKHFSRLR